MLHEKRKNIPKKSQTITFETAKSFPNQCELNGITFLGFSAIHPEDTSH